MAGQVLSAQSNYWFETLAESFVEHGITATDEQIALVANDVQGSHENYGLAFPTPSGPHPLQRELDDTKKKLRKEQDKIVCRECWGEGRLISYGPYHSGNSQCWKCRGEGRHAP